VLSVWGQQPRSLALLWPWVTHHLQALGQTLDLALLTLLERLVARARGEASVRLHGLGLRQVGDAELQRGSQGERGGSLLGCVSASDHRRALGLHKERV